MARVSPALLTVGLVAGVAVLGSIAGRALWESVTAQDEPRAEPPSEETIRDEAAKPRFQGQLLGVFIGPPGAKVPDQFVTYEETCGSEPTEEVGWDKAGELGLAGAMDAAQGIPLPVPFRLNSDSLNTGVVACGGKVYAARWEYSAPQPNGYPGSLVIARSYFKYAEFDVSAERVKEIEIGGLPAIFIEPLSPTGVSSVAGVIFPGDSVTTVISSSGVPHTDLLKVAEIVASLIKED